MRDLSGLPLFAAAAGGKIEPVSSATILAFPVSRDRRLVAALADAFVELRRRHGDRSRDLLIARRFRPIRVRLRGFGHKPDAIDQELGRLESAVAAEVWHRDGQPTLRSSRGPAA